MRRIVIVGSPGAGKSILAVILGEKLNLPVVHLDSFYHQKKPDYINNEVAWVKKVKQLIAKDEWIIDGNYNSTLLERFGRADTIIFLDYPRRVSMTGVLKRRIEFRNKVRTDMPSDWKEKIDFIFLKYVWNFNKHKRSKVLNALKEVKGKNQIILRDRKSTQAFLSSL